MKHTLRGFLIALALAGLVRTAAQAQEIKGKKQKEEIIARGVGLLRSAMLPGVYRLHCTFGCGSLRALYDSLWAAAPDTTVPPKTPFKDVRMNLFVEETPTLEIDSMSLPPDEEGALVLERRVRTMESYLTGIFGFWLHMDEMTFRSGAKNRRVRRDAGGYVMEDRRDGSTVRARLTSDYVLTDVEITDPSGVRGTVRTVFTRLGDRLRLDSLRLDVIRDGRPGHIAIAYTYAEVQGHLVPSSVAVRAEHLIPVVDADNEDFPLDETLTFGDYWLGRE
jgi:hypothetical protein